MEQLNVRRLPDDWTAAEEALLTALDDATATPITRELAEEWFAGVGWVIDDVEQVVARRPEMTLGLVEHLVLRLERALGSIDDSDRAMGVAFGRVLALHRQLAGDAHVARLRALGDLELLA